MDDNTEYYYDDDGHRGVINADGTRTPDTIDTERWYCFQSRFGRFPMLYIGSMLTTERKIRAQPLIVSIEGNGVTILGYRKTTKLKKTRKTRVRN